MAVGPPIVENQAASGSIDPVSAVANAVGQIFSGIFGTIQLSQAQQLEQLEGLPDWIDVGAYLRQEDKSSTVIVALSAVLVVILIIVVFVALKK